MYLNNSNAVDKPFCAVEPFLRQAHCTFECECTPPLPRSAYIGPVGDSRESGNLTVDWSSQQGTGVRRGRPRGSGLRTASV
jgi:hypothetical protein